MDKVKFKNFPTLYFFADTAEEVRDFEAIMQDYPTEVTGRWLSLPSNKSRGFWQGSIIRDSDFHSMLRLKYAINLQRDEIIRVNMSSRW